MSLTVKVKLNKRTCFDDIPFTHKDVRCYFACFFDDFTLQPLHQLSSYELSLLDAEAGHKSNTVSKGHCLC